MEIIDLNHDKKDSNQDILVQQFFISLRSVKIC